MRRTQKSAASGMVVSIDYDMPVKQRSHPLVDHKFDCLRCKCKRLLYMQLGIDCVSACLESRSVEGCASQEQLVPTQQTELGTRKNIEVQVVQEPFARHLH